MTEIKLDTWGKRMGAVSAIIVAMSLLLTGGYNATVWALSGPLVTDEELAEEMGLWKQELTGNYVKQEDLQYQFDMLRFDERENKLLDAIKRVNIKESLEPLTPTDKALRASWQSDLLKVQKERSQYLQSHSE